MMLKKNAELFQDNDRYEGIYCAACVCVCMCLFYDAKYIFKISFTFIFY